MHKHAVLLTLLLSLCAPLPAADSPAAEPDQALINTWLGTYRGIFSPVSVDENERVFPEYPDTLTLNITYDRHGL